MAYDIRIGQRNWQEYTPFGEARMNNHSEVRHGRKRCAAGLSNCVRAEVAVCKRCCTCGGSRALSLSHHGIFRKSNGPVLCSVSIDHNGLRLNASRPEVGGGSRLAACEDCTGTAAIRILIDRSHCTADTYNTQPRYLT